MNTQIALEYHLTMNHYPPLPREYVGFVMDAISAYEDDVNGLVYMPTDTEPVPRQHKVINDDTISVSAAHLLEITHAWGFVGDIEW